MAVTLDDPAVRWLLESKDPSIRFLTLTKVLGQPLDSPTAKKAKGQILRGPMVQTLFSGQRSDGGFGVHPYQKWTGAHWRLVSLVDLGVDGTSRKAVAAANQVLGWLTGDAHRRRIATVNGRTRRCASQEGNALGVCSRLGMAEDPRVRLLAESLTEWQWPDGGWNCDVRPEADHSSFYESLAPLWGLLEYHLAAGDKESLRTAKRTAEFFLMHRLFLSDKTGDIINPEWLKLHYPLYWHYDILQALRILSLLDKLRDSRVQEALSIIKEKRRPDGCWRAGGRYWYPYGRTRTMGKRRIVSNIDVVDWGQAGPNLLITLNALTVLKAAGHLA